MKASLIAWLATAAVFLAIDAIWLGWVAKSFYRDQIGGLMLDQPKLGVAALFYLAYTVAIVILASAPAARSASLTQAIVLGAVFGFAAYGAYEFTNLATLKDWPWTMVAVDMVWGTFLTALAATVGYATLRHLS